MSAIPTISPRERLTLTITHSLKKRMEAAVPGRQRSAFASKALEEALKVLARKEALKMLDELPMTPTGGEDSMGVQCRYRVGFDKPKESA